MPVNEDPCKCGLTFHFKLEDIYLIFTMSKYSLKLFFCFFKDVYLSQQNICCNHAYYLITAAVPSSYFPLPLMVLLSVRTGRSCFKESKEDSSICVKTAAVYIFEHIQ